MQKPPSTHDSEALPGQGAMPLPTGFSRTEAASERLRRAQRRFAEEGSKSPRNWIMTGLAVSTAFFMWSLIRRNWTLTRVTMGFFIALLDKLQEASMADRMLEKQARAAENPES